MPHPEVLVGVNSKKQLSRFKLLNKDIFFVVIVLLTTIISKTIQCNSKDVEGQQKFSLREHAFIWYR